MAKVIKLKESDILKLVQKVINEQREGEPTFTSISDAVHYIEDLLNTKILPEMQRELLNRYTIRIIRNPSSSGNREEETYTIVLKSIFEGKPMEYRLGNELTYVKDGQYMGKLDARTLIGDIDTEVVLDKVKEDEKVADFLTKFPKFEEEIKNGVVDVVLGSQGKNDGLFTLTYVGLKRGKLEGSVPAGQEYPLGDFFERNSLPMVVNKDLGVILQSGYLSLTLSKFYFSGPGVQSYASTTGTGGEKPKTGTTATEKEFKLSFYIVDAFKFDEDNFSDEATAMGQVDKLVNDIKMGINRFGDELVKHIMNWEPKIIGYASIDADPNEKITGKYGACKSKPNRGEYNKCLSEFRAKKIADILNAKLEGTGITFGYVGAGETTKFGPGWTKEKPTTTKETAPNRRFVLTPIAPFSKTIKVEK